MPKILNNKKNIFILIGLVGFILILFCANLLSSFLILQSEKVACNLSTNQLTYYAVYFDKALSEKSGTYLAQDYQKLGAGGYVFEDGDYFYILSSCYLNKNDALLVQNSIKTNHNLETNIIEIDVPSVNYILTVDSEEKKVFQKALNVFENAYKLLFDIAISLDTLVYNEISARLAINSAFSNINTIVSDFNILFKNSEDKNINTLQTYLKNLMDIMQKLCGGFPINEGQTLTSLIKYRYCEIIDLSIKFEREINK